MTDMFAGHNEKKDEKKELNDAFVDVAKIAVSRQKGAEGDQNTQQLLKSLPYEESLVRDVITKIDGNGNGTLLAIYNGQFQEVQALGNERGEEDEVKDSNITNDGLDAKLLAALNSAKGMILSYVAYCLEKGIEVDVNVINDLVGSVYASNQSDMDLALENDSVKEFNSIKDNFASFSKSGVDQKNLTEGLNSLENPQADFDDVMDIFKTASNTVSVSRTGEKQITLDDVSEKQMEEITKILGSEGVEEGGNSTALNVKPPRDNHI